jgi:5-bromo-4-chloroindolyl phosphate hydrolysis protein
MDCWSHSQVLTMLEGGNEQLQNFFKRHDMGGKSRVFNQRYQTKAARFYRKNMDRHVSKIEQIGKWMGRAASRKVAQTPTKRIQDIRPIEVPVQ